MYDYTKTLNLLYFGPKLESPQGFDAIKRNSSQPNYMRDDHTLKNTGKSFLN